MDRPERVTRADGAVGRQPAAPSEPLRAEPLSAEPLSAHDPSRLLPRPAQLIGLIAVAVLSYGTILAIVSLRTLLVILLVSLFIAFAVEPAVQWLGRHRWRRGPATAVVFLGSFLALAGTLGSLVPLLVDQIGELLRSAPRTTGEINDLLARIPLVELQLDPAGDLNQELLRLGREIGAGGGLTDLLTGNVLGAAGSVLGLGATAVALLFHSATVLLISFYMVADGPRMRATLARPLPPHRQREMLAIWELAVAKTGGYIYSRLLLAVIAAVVTAAGLAVMGVPYPLPLGIWVGVTAAFIPVIGTYLGGALPIVVALVDNPISALWVLIFITVYQQVENYVLAPRLQAATMDVHPAVAFTSVIVGATLLGAVGALLALPAVAIITALASTYLHRHDLIDELIVVSAELDDQLGDLPPLTLGTADPEPADPEPLARDANERPFAGDTDPRGDGDPADRTPTPSELT